MLQVLLMPGLLLVLPLVLADGSMKRQDERVPLLIRRARHFGLKKNLLSSEQLHQLGCPVQGLGSPRQV